MGEVLRRLTVFFTSLDFRKPNVRLAAYWLGAFAFLGLLFLSIHHLNIKREGAMKNAPRHLRVKAVAVPAPAPVETKKETPAEPVPAPVPETQIPAAELGTYAIQVATFAAPEDARHLVSRLGQGQFSSFVKPLSRAGGKVYYCVFIGRFKTFRHAQKQLEVFRRTPDGQSFKDAFVRSLE